MREASSLVLSARLQADGATVRAYDPVAEKEARKLMVGVEFADKALDAVDRRRRVRDRDRMARVRRARLGEVAERMRGSLVIDGRNFVDPDAVRAAGFIYEGIGR